MARELAGPRDRGTGNEGRGVATYKMGGGHDVLEKMVVGNGV